MKKFLSLALMISLLSLLAIACGGDPIEVTGNGNGSNEENQDNGDNQENQDNGDNQENQDNGDNQENQDNGDNQENQDNGDETGGTPGDHDVSGVRYCSQVCDSPEDCLHQGADESDYECNDNFCDFVGEEPGCSTNSDCVEPGLGTCLDSGVCGCTGDQQCQDAGAGDHCTTEGYCLTVQCETNDDCADVFLADTCFNGVCGCSSNESCTVPGLSCR